ncbi:IS481 family transposase [Thiocystis violascens]|uniref:Integrase family protein n=1 Tax=Thiocystis violascens (strain ATCC 17096 / DSM 198 / 6111) TaxID=765911 RepID=I3Y8N6_THIV6|nr:IS481 family transposase [Thiocystis violascens]AFL72266.1 integrase family protein [Thiocystis violascens DSM 198]AFL73354.1 integrase family protein [Thiocystis violascens DSM 198]
MTRHQLPPEALLDLCRRRAALAPRSPERRALIQQTAALYGVSEDALYRALRARARPKALNRADRGVPRVLPPAELEHDCEVIAALKIRTSNKKGRHLSTVQAIRLLEEHGVETPAGLLRAPAAVLTRSTVNHYLKQWGFDDRTLTRVPPAVRFEARHSNDCWQFDLSPSDLKQVARPAWFEEGRGHPLLMLYSVVDDRSGVAYQEYHGVYGEDVEAALRFLFNAMAPKSDPELPFQGRPAMLYMDSGPIGKSLIFHRVMDYLGIEVRTHMPKDSDGRRPTARAKGKVERPFRSVKEMHETLYHLHAPETEAEANAWLLRFLIHYNRMPHRREPHARIDDWLANLPPDGVRAMCSWERFGTFAREPERRKVGVDARVSLEGTLYQVDPDLAGEDVILWWGLFDNALYVEHGERRFGPYDPVGGPIPLHRYRSFKKTKTQQRAERIAALAEQLALPGSVWGGPAASVGLAPGPVVAQTPFVDPDPFQDLAFPTAVAAKRAIAEYLGTPLAKLPAEALAALDVALAESLRKVDVIDDARTHLKPLRGG